jgi:hypothetical protein
VKVNGAGGGKVAGMKQQMSFAQSEYAGKKKVTRRERFLGEMERVVPWARLCAVIEPHYPQGRRGRPPIGIERMSAKGQTRPLAGCASTSSSNGMRWRMRRSKMRSTTARRCAPLPGSI